VLAGAAAGHFIPSYVIAAFGAAGVVVAIIIAVSRPQTR
jgi:hypothetical protein